MGDYSFQLPRHEPVKLDKAELDALLLAAQEAADAAAKVTCQYFRNAFTVSNKDEQGAFDPVTEADRQAELVIREHLQSCYPDIGFFGEEHAASAGRTGLLWVVDPIDGTRAFMSGMPLWGTLIALYDGRNAVLGLIDQPFLKERYSACNQVATITDRSGTRVLSTRSVDQLASATMYCTTPDMFEDGKPRRCFDSVRRAVQLTRYGGDCYAYALLASGFVDIVLDCDLQPYDIQAIIPIVDAAGGTVTNWSGDSAVDGGYVVACGSQALHAKTLELLADLS